MFRWKKRARPKCMIAKIGLKIFITLQYKYCYIVLHYNIIYNIVLSISLKLLISFKWHMIKIAVTLMGLNLNIFHNTYSGSIQYFFSKD